MSWIATSVAIGGSALLGYFGSQSAANTEANAANNASASQQAMFNTEQQTEAPYVKAGDNALTQIQNNMGYYNQPFTQAQFQQDPGYQFDLQQGQLALEQNAAATGMTGGGEAAALSNYSQNMASNEYQNAFNRYQSQMTNSYNRLAGIAQLGQGAAANVGSAAIQTGANIGNSQIAAGNASAAGTMAGVNAISGAVSTGINAYTGQQMLNRLAPQSTPSGITDSGIGNLNGSQSLTMPEVGSEYNTIGSF